jgi:hypothetical protein
MPEAAEGLDRAWLEAHLKGLAQRLQDTLAQANPERTLAALTGRLETIEQRFGATLGRVAQRADLDGLRAIEARVLELAGQLEQARERLDRIGAIDDEVHALARKVEEATGVQRASGLEKLLRDCIAEWREGEQRTASALQHIEEAIGRLGETVDAMEASKPAPDLTVPPLSSSDLGLAAAGASLLRADEVAVPASPLYQATLDAADYAPKAFAGETLDASEPSLPTREAQAPDDSVDWPQESLPDTGSTEGRPAGAKLTPGALRIMALRAKLRQSNGRERAGMLPPVSPGAMAEPPHGSFRRASLSVLLLAGAALVASSTYYLYETFVTPAPASPAMVAPAVLPMQGKG